MLKYIKLTTEEEAVLIKAWQTKRDQQAQETLIASKLPYIRKVIKGMQSRATWVSLDDAMAWGVLYLIELLDQVDTKRGKLITILGIGLPRWMLIIFNKDRLISLPNQYTTEYLDGKYSDRWEITKCHLLSEECSYEHEVSDESVSDEVINKLELEENTRRITEFLALLSPREQTVLIKRSQGETLAAIGGHIGVSRQRTREIEQAAHRKIRRMWLDKYNQYPEL